MTLEIFSSVLWIDWYPQGHSFSLVLCYVFTFLNDNGLINEGNWCEFPVLVHLSLFLTYFCLVGKGWFRALCKCTGYCDWKPSFRVQEKRGLKVSWEPWPSPYTPTKVGSILLWVCSIFISFLRKHDSSSTIHICLFLRSGIIIISESALLLLVISPQLGLPVSCSFF